MSLRKQGLYVIIEVDHRGKMVRKAYPLKKFIADGYEFNPETDSLYYYDLVNFTEMGFKNRIKVYRRPNPNRKRKPQPKEYSEIETQTDYVPTEYDRFYNAIHKNAPYSQQGLNLDQIIRYAEEHFPQAQILPNSSRKEVTEILMKYVKKLNLV